MDAAQDLIAKAQRLKTETAATRRRARFLRAHMWLSSLEFAASLQDAGAEIERHQRFLKQLRQSRQQPKLD